MCRCNKIKDLRKYYLANNKNNEIALGCYEDVYTKTRRDLVKLQIQYTLKVTYRELRICV